MLEAMMFCHGFFRMQAQVHPSGNTTLEQDNGGHNGACFVKHLHCPSPLHIISI